MALHLHTANDLDALVKLFCSQRHLNQEKDSHNPFKPQVILVQSQGMRHWLSLNIAKKHAICMGYQFLFPNAFLDQLQHLYANNTSQKFHTTHPPLPASDDNPYHKDYLIWQIWHLLITKKNDNALPKSFKNALKNDFQDQNSYLTAKLCADLFDQYLVFRPNTLKLWEKGITPTDNDNFQIYLWKALSQMLGKTHRHAIFENLLQAIDAYSAPLHKHFKSIDIFGISTLPPFFIQLITHLAKYIPIHFYFFKPFSNSQDKDNPLLSYLKQQGQEMLQLIRQYAPSLQQKDYFSFQLPKNPSLFTMFKATLLNQQDNLPIEGILDNYLDNSTDNSIQIHQTTHPWRELEILREKILFLLAEKQYTVNDIVVMAPDIEAYAPYIDPIFSQHHGNHSAIPYTIGDRSIMHENTASRNLLELLHFFQGRWTLSEVFNLFEIKAIQAKIGFDDPTLFELKNIVKRYNIRWAFDHKKEEPVPPFDEYSWKKGFDDMMKNFGIWQAQLTHPLANDHSQTHLSNPFSPLDKETIGLFMHFLNSLWASHILFSQAATLSTWANRLTALIEQCFLFESSFHHTQLLQHINDLDKQEYNTHFNHPIPLSTLQLHLESLLTEKKSHTGFLIGNLTFCSMLPMRSIPFKVICLIGLNDDNFPRKDIIPAFSLLKKHQLGDRSRQKDDYYLFLEAIHSAQDILYLSYCQHTPKSAHNLMSFVLNECIELLKQLFIRYQKDTPSPQEIKTFIEKILVKHPLKPYDSSYFVSDAPFKSYSTKYLTLCQNLVAQKEKIPLTPNLYTQCAHYKPPTTPLSLHLRQIAHTLTTPFAAFYKQHIGTLDPISNDPNEDNEPFRLSENGLQKYSIKDDFTSQRLTKKTFSLQTLYDFYRQNQALPLHAIGKEDFYHTYYQEIKPYSDCLNSFPPTTLKEISLDVTDQNDSQYLINAELKLLNANQLFLHRPSQNIHAIFIEAWLSLLILANDSPSDIADNPPLSAIILYLQNNHTPALVTLNMPKQAESHLKTILHYSRLALSKPIAFFSNASFIYAEQKINAQKHNKPFKKILRQQLHKAKDYIYIEKIFGGKEICEEVIFNNKALIEESMHWAEKIYCPLFIHLKPFKK